jgi:hypothetical protein
MVKNQQKEFNSNTIKNDIIWKQIGTELAKEGICFTPIQCKDKHKYLNSKYTKKMENECTNQD